MPNIASVLKSEISRLARKEVKTEIDSLKKAHAASRVELASLRKRVSELEGALKRAMRSTAPHRTVAKPIAAPSEALEGLRFRASGMAANRKRLGLSAAAFGALIGATGQSVYSWEAGKSKPNPTSLAAIAALRGVGKREVEARLEALRS